MSVTLKRSCCAAALLVLSTQSALADLTAEQVWNDWKAYMTGMGYEFSASENKSGTTLNIDDVTLSFPIPEEDTTMSVTMSDWSFEEQGDGSVHVLLPAEMPMTISADGDDAFSIELIYSHDGKPMIVTGDADEMTYEYSSSALAFVLGEISAPGEELPADAIKFSMSMTDFASTTVMKIADLRDYSQTYSAANLSYDFSARDPDSEDQASLKGSLNNLSASGESQVPANLSDPTDYAALLAAGFGFTAEFTYEGGKTEFNFVDGRDNLDFDSSSEGGRFAGNMTDGSMAYDLLQKGVALNIIGSDIPFPLNLNMAELGMNMKMPLAESEEEQDFALGLALRDFAVPELLWALVDPQGQLPHDPASIVVDMTGTGKLAVNLMDPTAIEALEDGDTAPGELNSMQLNNLLISAAGAKLTGSGDFSFNNDDLETFDGMPAPSGEANLKLEGANTLIDKLIGMGLMSDQDAMGARMMMGMLAVPGEGEDTLTSKIEVGEDGSIKANGQRIR